MAKVVREVDGVEMMVTMGGAERCSLGFEKKGGAEVREDGVVATSKGEQTAPVSSAYQEGRGGRFGLPNKQPPTISPTMPHSTRAVREGAVGTEQDTAQPRPRVRVPCFGPGPTALGTVYGPGPGLLSVY